MLKMDATLVGLDIADGWVALNEGVISRQQGLEKDIQCYFGVKEDLSGFFGRDSREVSGFELKSSEADRGYVFVCNSSGRSNDFKLSMEHLRRICDSQNKIKILMEFVDYENEVAGFSWRKE